jgi:hypothetical protein
VEVEGVAVGAREARVAARHAGVEIFAHCTYIDRLLAEGRRSTV